MSGEFYLDRYSIILSKHEIEDDFIFKNLIAFDSCENYLSRF